MKRKSLMSLVLCIFMFMFLFMDTTVSAQSGGTVKIDELGISITIPSEYVMFTQDISADDPDLKEYDISRNDLAGQMKSDDTFLCAWDKSGTHEITVSLDESNYYDFYKCSDLKLMELMSEFEDQMKTTGNTILEHDIYQHSQTKFIKFVAKKPEKSNTSYEIMYYTINDGDVISLELNVYSGNLDKSYEKVMESIVDSIKFEKDPSAKQADKSTKSFVFNDSNTGCKFTVPANWSNVDVSTDEGMLDAEFDYNIAPEFEILYGSADLCASLSSKESVEAARQMFDSSSFSADDYAGILGVPASEISTVKYNGKEYFLTEAQKTNSVGNKKFTIIMTTLARFENGIMYTFKFFGDPKSTYYKDFESILNTVNYPGQTN